MNLSSEIHNKYPNNRPMGISRWIIRSISLRTGGSGWGWRGKERNRDREGDRQRDRQKHIEEKDRKA